MQVLINLPATMRLADLAALAGTLGMRLRYVPDIKKPQEDLHNGQTSRSQTQ